jgi:hypothetical protein
LIFFLNSRVIVSMFLVAVLLDSLVFIYGFQMAIAQQRLPQSLSPPELSAANAIATSSNSPHAAAANIFHVNKTAGVSELTWIIVEVSVHYPTPQEKNRVDKIVNQTLSMLQPMGKAINESHRCILEAVICGNSNMTNGTMLRL